MAVHVVPYDPEWPRRFERERAVLETIFTGLGVAIEHVGSTAVPGLAAKPVIDMMLGVSRLDDVDARVPALEAAGYEYAPEYEVALPERRYFRRPVNGPRRFHLHCVIKDGAFWVRHLAFRDHLRAHPPTAAAYHRLKVELAARDGKQAYAARKSPFIEQVLSSLGAR